METLTLEQHFAKIRERQKRSMLPKGVPQKLNAFAEEIERAKTATIEAIRPQLPPKITEPYGEIELYPGFQNPARYANWKQMREEDYYRTQPIPGLATIKVDNWVRLLGTTTEESGSLLKEFGIKILPFKNEIFGLTLCGLGEKINPFINIDKTQIYRNNIWAFTQEDVTQARLALQGNYYCRPELPGEIYAYFVGIAKDMIRAPTAEEIKELSRPLLAKHVFGLIPPTTEEIKTHLIKTYVPRGRLEDALSYPFDYFLLYSIEPRESDDPLTEEVVSLIRDVKESKLFEKLEFGSFGERTKWPDHRIASVLVGTYKGIRIPLAHWRSEKSLEWYHKR